MRCRVRHAWAEGLVKDDRCRRFWLTSWFRQGHRRQSPFHPHRFLDEEKRLALKTGFIMANTIDLEGLNGYL